MKPFKLGHFWGLDVVVEPSAVIGTLALWILFSGIGLALLEMSAAEAILGGLIAVLLWWVSEFLHQRGHAWAAERAGYPMTGVALWGVLGRSLYPPNEPALPGRTHIQRALGGPIWSFVIALLALVVVLLLQNQQGTLLWWLAVLVVVVNLGVFSLGAFVPLPFTDGGTILRWRGK